MAGRVPPGWCDVTISPMQPRSRLGQFGVRTLVASIVMLVLNWATPAQLYRFGVYSAFDAAHGLTPGARVHPLPAPRALPRSAQAEAALPQTQKSAWSLGDRPDGLPLRAAAECADCVGIVAGLAGDRAALRTTARGFDARAPPVRL
jgi:hypothetical protein